WKSKGRPNPNYGLGKMYWCQQIVVDYPDAKASSLTRRLHRTMTTVHSEQEAYKKALQLKDKVHKQAMQRKQKSYTPGLKDSPRTHEQYYAMCKSWKWKAVHDRTLPPVLKTERSSPKLSISVSVSPTAQVR
ncbi:MAG: hypothetical protein Q9181_007716, partial [Wetmoreana brouardii]